MGAKETEFGALFAEHYGAILRYAQRRINDSEIARELAGECFAIAWQKFDPACPIELPWLYQTTRFLLSNEFRRYARETEALSLAAMSLDVRVRSDDVIDMRIALARLSASERELVRLSYWEGLSANEISRVLGITEGAVRVRLTRARSRLRGLLTGSQVVGGVEGKLADDLG